MADTTSATPLTASRGAPAQAATPLVSDVVDAPDPGGADSGAALDAAADTEIAVEPMSQRVAARQGQVPPQPTRVADAGQTPLPTPEVAGIRTSVNTVGRTSLKAQVLPKSSQNVSGTTPTMPSTGEPSVALLATSLLLLGGAGLWLRRLGARRN